ncbi:MAG: hypothetical protein NVS3B20_16850 [Polyangiales bacterium]
MVLGLVGYLLRSDESQRTSRATHVGAAPHDHTDSVCHNVARVKKLSVLASVCSCKT